MMSQLSTVKIERGLRNKLNLLHDSDFGIINKKEINNIMADFNEKKTKSNKRKTNRNKTVNFGGKTESQITPPEVCGAILEYKMSRTLAEEIIKSNRSNPQKALCDYVNSDCGLKGYCVRVIVEAN
jgi:hypothetical protein